MNTNLVELLNKKQITMDTLAAVIHCTPKTAGCKVRRKNAFTLPEALLIKNALFPEYELNFIFKGYDTLDKDQDEDVA